MNHDFAENEECKNSGEENQSKVNFQKLHEDQTCESNTYTSIYLFSFHFSLKCMILCTE